LSATGRASDRLKETQKGSKRLFFTESQGKDALLFRREIAYVDAVEQEQYEEGRQEKGDRRRETGEGRQEKGKSKER